MNNDENNLDFDLKYNLNEKRLMRNYYKHLIIGKGVSDDNNA